MPFKFCQEFASQHGRKIRVTVSLVVSSAANYVIGSSLFGKADQDAGDHASAQAAALGGLVLMGAAYYIQPGTVGNADVERKSQKSLVETGWNQTFGTAEDGMYTFARVLCLSMATAVGGAMTSQPLAMQNFLFSGASLPGYVADRSWGACRMLRYEPDQSSKATKAIAWLMNFIIGNYLDSCAMAVGWGMQRFFTGEPLAKPGGEQYFFLSRLLPMMAGSLVSQLMQGAAYTVAPDSWWARIPAHGARLGARYGVRSLANYTRSMNQYQLAIDAVGACFMHRWPDTKATPARFVNSLHVKGLDEHDFLSVERQPVVAGANEIINVNVTIHLAENFGSHPFNYETPQARAGRDTKHSVVLRHNDEVVIHMPVGKSPNAADFHTPQRPKRPGSSSSSSTTTFQPEPKPPPRKS